MSKIVEEALKDSGLSSSKEVDRCKNFFALGLVYWLYGRDMDADHPLPARRSSASKPEILEGNMRALKAGWNYGETTDAFASSYQVDKAKLPPGVYKNIMGNEAMAWGLMTAAQLSGKELFLGSYPITPASDILHELSKFKNYGVRTFQAEDEIAAICSAIGAAYGGHMAITTSSGPGIALKGEAIGLAIMTGAAAAGHQHSARRPEHRPADEDRAGRPVPGDSAAATANRRCRSSPPRARPTALTWPRKPGGSPPAS